MPVRLQDAQRLGSRCLGYLLCALLGCATTLLFQAAQFVDQSHIGLSLYAHNFALQQAALCTDRPGPLAVQAGAIDSAAVQQDCTKRPVTCGQSRRMELLRAHLVAQNVTALVFYGRRRQARILVAYLERNLVQNGGVLHQVTFVVKTKDTADLAFLEGLLLQHPGVYVKHVVKPVNKDYREMYSSVQDDRLYVKIDDDIVFIQDGAIEELLQEYLARRFLFVSANVVNHPLLSAVHNRMGATLPFHPPPGMWRDSGRDWLLRAAPDALDGTFMGRAPQGPFSKCTWKDWRCAAIAHYSFLHRWQHQQLAAYDFRLWDFHTLGYERWSINFMVFNGSDLPQRMPKDDEAAISQTIPRAWQYHAAAVGSALVVHFSYAPQDSLINRTNLLAHYEELAMSITGKQLMPLQG